MKHGLPLSNFIYELFTYKLIYTTILTTIIIVGLIDLNYRKKVSATIKLLKSTLQLYLFIFLIAALIQIYNLMKDQAKLIINVR